MRFLIDSTLEFKSGLHCINVPHDTFFKIKKHSQLCSDYDFNIFLKKSHNLNVLKTTLHVYLEPQFPKSPLEGCGR